MKARVIAALGAAAFTLSMSGDASAGPNEGEARSLLRDGDRVYTVVAGEADGASTVTNPANLGFLRGVNGVFDAAWTATSTRRRGSAVGAFVGIPIPGAGRLSLLSNGQPWFSLGLGYQFIYPVQPEAGGDGDIGPSQPDEPFSKVTIAAAVPLGRVVRGLSLGLNYSRLISASNFHAGTNQVDVGLGYWPARYVGLGVVGRGLNVPQTGPDGQQVTQAITIDPEVAIRPLGTPAFELAGGVRVVPRPSNEVRFQEQFAAPRGRVFVGAGPARIFAEVERFRYFPVNASGIDQSRDAARITAGIELSTPHVGVAIAALTSAGGRNTFGVDGGAGRVRISQERYRGLQPAYRRVLRLSLAGYGGDRGLWKAIAEIEDAAARGGDILVEARGMEYGWAQIEELREAIIRARLQGSRVFVYLEGGTLRHYFLAAAAEQIIAHPNNSLSILGMRIESFYYADLLAKLGAKAEFVRIAEYKAVPERWGSMTASEPTAHQRKQLTSDIWNHVLRTVSRERGQDTTGVKRWIDHAPLHPPRALQDGVIDGVAYPDQLDARLEQLLGKKIRLEKPSSRADHEHMYGAPRRIAVLLIEGDIADSESFVIPLLGRKVAGSYTLTKEIEKLREDNGVEAVVVRINSPGGSVSAADAIARELDLTRQVKPVVISMGNKCASGGYYIATGGQYIYADATTLTGSIGIFYPKVDISGTLELLGVGVDTYNFGRRAGLRSWFKPYSDDEKAAALQDIQDSYSIFTGRVATARSMTLAQVDKVARGRVWSGVRGLEIGLVDAYGGMREAVMRARAIAGLRPGEAAVEFYPRKPGQLENLRRILGFDIPLPFGGGVRSNAGVRGAAALGGFGLPAAVIKVLGLLPTGLWHSAGPAPLALAEETIVIAD